MLSRYLNSTLILITPVLILTGCNTQFDAKFFTQNSQSGEVETFSAQQITAFKSTFYAFTQTQGCVKCHGNNVNPRFASANINQAYNAAKGFRNGSSSVKLIDFDNPSNSIFIEYAGNAHCGDTPCSDPLVRPLVESNLEMWSAAEKAMSEGPNPTPKVGPKFLTGSLKVPAVIPSVYASVPAVLRFPLSELKPALLGLQNAILEIEIKMASDNQYRLTNPKIYGNTMAIAVTDITVYKKLTNDPDTPGIEDSDIPLNWHNVTATAAIFARPGTLPTTPVAAVPLINLPIYFDTATKADYFTVGFGDLK